MTRKGAIACGAGAESDLGEGAFNIGGPVGPRAEALAIAVATNLAVKNRWREKEEDGEEHEEQQAPKPSVPRSVVCGNEETGRGGEEEGGDLEGAAGKVEHDDGHEGEGEKDESDGGVSLRSERGALVGESVALHLEGEHPAGKDGEGQEHGCAREALELAGEWP